MPMENGLRRTAGITMIIALSMGCAQESLYRPDGAQPVVRDINWKKWRRFQPEQSVTFGAYQVIAPRKSAVGGITTTISSFQDSRLKGSIEFDLLESGVAGSHVTVKLARTVKSVDSGNDLGTLRIDDKDQMDGQILIGGTGSAEFSLAGFHKGSLRGEAFGELKVNGSRIILREVEPAWHEQTYGFAGADFSLNEIQVGQVICGRKETFWVDPNQPPEIRIAIASVAATILVTDRLEPDPM